MSHSFAVTTTAPQAGHAAGPKTAPAEGAPCQEQALASGACRGARSMSAPAAAPIVMPPPGRGDLASLICAALSWAGPAAKRGFFAVCALVLLASAALAAGLATPPVTSALPAFASPSTEVSLGETALDAEGEDAFDEEDSRDESGWDRDLLLTKAVAELSRRGSEPLTASSNEESPGRAVSLGLFRPPQA